MTPASPSPAKRTADSAGTAGTVGGRAVSPAARAFLANRGWSERILDVLPVRFGTDRGRECVFFGQYVNGEAKGYKARPLDAKEFWQKPGTPQRLWNLDALEGDAVWLTEGEPDACSLVEAGISHKNVVSIFGGAKGEEDTNLKQAQEALEQLQGMKRITLVHDADAPGLALRKCLAKVLGAARVRYIDWPEGTKDANDYLRSDGPEALRSLVTDGSRPWPVEGLFRLSDLPEPPPLELWDAGFPEWEGGVKLAPTKLSVVTGHGGHGKTRMMAQIWQQVADAHGVRIAVCTMETLAKPGYRRYLREAKLGKDQFACNESELRWADQWIEDHYRFIQHPERKPSLQWLLDVAEVAVVREGCRAIVVDPWNKLERARSDRQSETDYISEVLDELMVFATDLDCHVQIIAHPAKAGFEARKRPPVLEDIHGSKAWDTKPDQGFCVWRKELFDGRERKTDCDFIVLKSRFEELGYSRAFHMKLDLHGGRYVSTDYEDAAGIAA